MTFTTLISTGELESMLGGPSLVLPDARFSLDDEGWGTAAYGEAHITSLCIFLLHCIFESFNCTH